MKGQTRRRADHSTPVRQRLASGLEALETRQLLSVTPGTYHPYAIPQPFPNERTVDPTTPYLYSAHPTGNSARQLSFLDNEGKVLTGKDRDGDEWSITVHGPGSVIVTDITPNDGSLDDELNTIQLVGTNPHTTYVTGQVTASARVITDGTIEFNHLISQNGVKSIVLNGFTLARTAPTPAGQQNNAGPEISLPGGVGLLSFHNILAEIDLAGNSAGSDQPFDILIGNQYSPVIKQRPTIQIDSIFNTVFDSSSTSQEGLGPQTTPTVNITVYGQLHALTLTSATAEALSGGLSFDFPRVDVTGRTAVRAVGVDHLKVAGSARNLTASRGNNPFRNGFQGLDHLGTADFGGNADAVGLDVNGNVGRVRFLKGLGNPYGAGSVPQNMGTDTSIYGYPSRGLIGGLVTARRIKHLVVGSANVQLITGQDPDYVQLDRQGNTKYYTRAGNALTSAAIVSQGSIGKTHIVGNGQTSEVPTGFDYTSYVAGLEPVRSPSAIRKLRLKGDLIDSVISSTYRANDNIYGNQNDTKGPGTITGDQEGVLYNTGAGTVLNNQGAGFYARHKHGYLPPPQKPTRIHGVKTS